MDFHFIDDPTTLNIISTILEIAGPNFNPPYDGAGQPSDAVARNDEALTQYDVPGGTTIRSTSNPAASPSMGWVISSLLTALGPVISAYGFILPILGVIRGIIEIMCCLMNPFCVIAAVIRLFVKWIPPFISLFPPLAGVVIILSTIKMILAIVFFILTEIVPTIQLIIKNITMVIDAISSKNEAKREAGKQKLIAVLIDLINRLGILAAAKPLLDLIFLILGLVAGFPCGGGKKSSKSTGNMNLGPPTFDQSILDTSCCNDTQCPPEIRTPPQGRALLIPRFYGDAPPLWTWKLYPITGHSNIRKLRPYLQDLRSQLNPQLDEEVDEATAVGSKYDAAHFRLRILGRRGEKFCKDSLSSPTPAGSKLVPIARLSNSGQVTVTNVNLIQYMGVVDYCIEPNYDQLVGRNILAVGCHPDVEAAKNGVMARFDDLELPALAKYPELSVLPELYNDMSGGLNSGLGEIQDLVEGDDLNYPNIIPRITEIRDELVDMLFNTANSLVGMINVILSRVTDRISSSFDVDKNVVRAGGQDKAIVSVTPRDVGGVPVAKNLPDGADISVEILTDFGTLQNQSRNNETGVITAELISPFPGRASVMAKVNTDFIMNFDGTTESVKVEKVDFVADAIMPKRRVVSKPSADTKTQTGVAPEREPGSR